MYEDAGNVLKVSWFIRDAGTGIEFGNDASHLENFGDEAMITNQEFGVSPVTSPVLTSRT